ncbi:MAG: DUF1194 domain-containing protein [Pseudomonadota bacterium]
MRWPGRILRVAAAALALGLAAPGAARACALELILALDVSGSIDAREFGIQTEGLAAAFEDPRLIAAIDALPGGIVVTMTHWSGISRQRQMTPWARIEEPADAHAFAASIRGAGRAWRNFSTAIGEAIMHARDVSETAPVDCTRRVLDISGDGVSNEGRHPSSASDVLAGDGFIINGLVIRGAEPDPVQQYLEQVIAGPGAFVEVADGFADYPRAILKKLLREIDKPLLVSEQATPSNDLARAAPDTPELQER